MALTYPCQTVSVSGLSPSGTSTWQDVDLVSISITPGSEPSTCELIFPHAYALESLPFRGQRITVKRGMTTIFIGHVVRMPGRLDDRMENQRVVAKDIRWQMHGIKVGQYGIGPRDPDRGGWPCVDFRLHFNPYHEPNRSALADSNTDQYTFDTKSGAQYWTRKQVLRLIRYWYARELLAINESVLDSAWDETVNNMLLELVSLTDAVTALANDCGQTWSIFFNNDTSYFMPITNDPADAFTADLPIVGASAKASQSSESSVLIIDGDPSIENSCDYVEVHSNRVLFEHTYDSVGSGGNDPLLVGFDPDDPDYVYGYRVDVTQYDNYNLGFNLEEGQQPKRWMPANITKRKPDSVGAEYYDAEADDMLAGLGITLRPQDCLWLDIDGTMTRIAGGFKILLDQGIILFKERVEFESGGWMEQDTAGAWELGDGIQCYITVTTELLQEEVVRSADPATWKLDSSNPLTESIFRSDLRSRRRYNCMLPDLTSSDPNAYTTVATSGIEKYVDITDELTAIGQKYLAARLPTELHMRVTLLGMPTAARPGKRFDVSNNSISLSGKEVIVGMYYDAANAGDHLILEVTNNLTRYIQ